MPQPPGTIKIHIEIFPCLSDDENIYDVHMNNFNKDFPRKTFKLAAELWFVENYFKVCISKFILRWGGDMYDDMIPFTFFAHKKSMFFS
jgi:hypothetical protein